MTPFYRQTCGLISKASTSLYASREVLCARIAFNQTFATQSCTYALQYQSLCSSLSTFLFRIFPFVNYTTRVNE
jgi:hypothetical protein